MKLFPGPFTVRHTHRAWPVASWHARSFHCNLRPKYRLCSWITATSQNINRCPLCRRAKLQITRHPGRSHRCLFRRPQESHCLLQDENGEYVFIYIHCGVCMHEDDSTSSSFSFLACFSPSPVPSFPPVPLFLPSSLLIPSSCSLCTFTCQIWFLSSSC